MFENSGRVRFVNNPEDSIDIRILFRIFTRRFFAFSSVALIIFSIITIQTLQSTPMYTASATIMIEPRQKEVADIESVLSAMPSSATALATQAELIRSRSLGERVVDNLDLVNDPEFNWSLRPRKTPSPWSLSSLKRQVVSVFSSAKPAQVAPVQISEEERERRLKENIVGSVLSRTIVARVGSTYMIQISFVSESPQKAAKIANEFADQYLLDQLEAKFDATARANDWLNERLEVLREEVRNAENAVEQYRAQSGLLSARGSSLTEQQISDINAQLVIQRAEYEEASARLESVRSQVARGNAADSLGEIFSSPLIRELRTEQATIERRKAELSARYGSLHPDIRNVEREAADIKAQIEQEVGRIVANLVSEVDVAEKKVRSLESSLGRLRSELTQNNSSLVRLRELERNAEANRSLYESFLNRFKETGEQESLNESDGRVVSAAVPAGGPSSPKVTTNLFIGLLAGITAGLIVIGLLEVFDNGLRTGEQAEQQLNVSFLGYVPHFAHGVAAPLQKLTFGSPDVLDFVVKKPFSRFSESIRSLKSSIIFSNLDEQAKTVAVTSPAPKDGKTTTSIALGALVAMSGAKAIVVDCDLRRRSLSKSFAKDGAVEKGLIEFLSGQVELKDAILHQSKAGLDVLPLSSKSVVTQDVFGSKAFSSLLEELRSKYDLVVLDTAPVLAVTETAAVANLVDAVVMAVRWRKTSTKAAKAAIKVLRNAKANLIGVTITQFHSSIASRMSDTYYTKTYSAYRKYYTE